MLNRLPARERAKRVWSGLVGLCAWALVSVLSCPVAEAQISFADLFRTGFYSQTGNGNTLTPGGYRFDTRLYSQNPGDFTTATMAYPGPDSPAVLSPLDATTLGFGSPVFPTQGGMDGAFPTGTYSYAASGPAGDDSASVEYAADAYPQSLPYLDGTTWADLQGMNATQPFVVHFSPFVTGAGADASFIFFTLYNTTTGMFDLDAGFLDPTTTSYTIPANTLTAGDNYIYEVIFSNRVAVDSPGAEFPAQLGFDLRTTGTFAATVPEPGALAVLALGGLGLLRRRR